jgi:hypothetical protein
MFALQNQPRCASKYFLQKIFFCFLNRLPKQNHVVPVYSRSSGSAVWGVGFERSYTGSRVRISLRAWLFNLRLCSVVLCRLRRPCGCVKSRTACRKLIRKPRGGKIKWRPRSITGLWSYGRRTKKKVPGYNLDFCTLTSCYIYLACGLMGWYGECAKEQQYQDCRRFCIKHCIPCVKLRTTLTFCAHIFKWLTLQRNSSSCNVHTYT